MQFNGAESVGMQAASVVHILEPYGFLREYRLPDVLTDYGAPTQIMAGISEDTHGGHYYALWLVYESQGIVFQYSGDALGSLEDSVICADDMASYVVSIYLLPPGEITIEDMASFPNAYSQWLQYTQQTLPIHPLVFQQVFSQPDPGGCIRVLDDGDDTEIFSLEDLNPIIPAQENQTINAMLQADAHCDLPCWQGITPGSTPPEQALIRWQELSPVVIHKQWSDDWAEYISEPLVQFSAQQLEYTLGQKYTVRDGQLSSIQVGASVPPWHLESPQLMQDWQDYSLSAILQKYGEPDVIMPSVDHVGCGSRYRLALYYQGLGFMVSYNGQVQRNEQEATDTICPITEPLYHIGLDLRTPNAYNEDNMIWSRWRGTIPDIDIDAFYETYSDPAATACMTFPAQETYTCP